MVRAHGRRPGVGVHLDIDDRQGQLTVEGPFYDTKDSVLAVTGGTGDYATARGEKKLHARDAKGSEYDFVYTLAP